jgi:hypothetical protein
MSKVGLRSIDALAAVIVTCLVLVGLWSALYQGPATGKRIREVQAELGETRAAQRAAQIAVERLQSEVTALAEHARNRGTLQDNASTEENLHALAQLARESNFELISVTPLPPQTYPGLTELRYTLAGRGSYTAWREFLTRFENAPFWADVTQVEMGAERGSSEDEKAAHAVAFTLSMFVPQPTEKGT